MQPLNFGDKPFAYQRGPSNPIPSRPRRDWMDALVDFLFSPDGRVTRAQYWVSGIVFGLVNLVVVFMIFRPVIAMLTGATPPAENLGYSLAEHLTLMIATGLLLWWSIVVSIKRWHDTGRSGLWELIILVPLVGPVWKLVVCGFFPGTDGTNRFGTPAA